MGSMNRYLAVFALLAASVSAARQPNILLIVSDDQGYMDLGSMGSSDILTPRLDRLAAEGVRLTSYYACLLYTSPSPRDGLLSRMPSSA